MSCMLLERQAAGSSFACYIRTNLACTGQLCLEQTEVTLRLRPCFSDVFVRFASN